MIEYIEWALKTGKLETASVTIEWLDKARNHTPGAVSRVLANMQLVANCEGMVSQLPESS